jgi:hypothetical protein
MSVTNVYKLASSQAGEIVESHSVQGADDDHALNLRSSRTMQVSDVVNKRRRNGIPLFVRNMRANDLGNSFSRELYVLQDLVKLSAHNSSLRKTGKSTSLRKGAEFVGTCALVAGVMMVGPILQAFGVIGG